MNKIFPCKIEFNWKKQISVCCVSFTVTGGKDNFTLGTHLEQLHIMEKNTDRE